MGAERGPIPDVATRVPPRLALRRFRLKREMQGSCNRQQPGRASSLVGRVGTGRLALVVVYPLRNAGESIPGQMGVAPARRDSVSPTVRMAKPQCSVASVAPAAFAYRFWLGRLHRLSHDSKRFLNLCVVGKEAPSLHEFPLGTPEVARVSVD